MNTIASAIEVGRMVRFFAGYGGTDGEGVIVAVHGTPNFAPPVIIQGGAGRVIRDKDCKIDVVLFDGRRLYGIHQCSIDMQGIGIKLLPRVHGPELIRAALENAAKYEADQALERARARVAFEEAEAARQIVDPPLFYWNGIRDAKGEKLQRAWYSEGRGLNGCPAGTITIYARDHGRFSAKVRACFKVENDTDAQVDYFDNDRFRVIPQHPLYPQVKAAMEACEARRARRRGGA